jgi:Tol biopolymer transport system component
MKDGAFHDGSRVYFTFFSPNSIAQVASSGGESVPVPTRVQGQMDFAIDLSPEGSELLIASFPGHGSKDYIWRANVLSGEARRLVAAEWGTFSPDGKSILYATAKGDILESDLNGSGMHRLASPGGQLIRPLLSPDGKLIRFEKDGKLWEMKSDGSGTHPMLSDWQMPGEQAAGSWTPDGKLFLFALKGLGSGGDQIWAIDERRHFFWQKSPSPFQLTSGPIHWAEAISGRDGKTLFAPGRTPRGELVRIDPKTGVAVPYLGGISAEFPSFSQDGKYVAYVIFPEGILWKANRDGTGRLQLTQPPIYPMVPRWSPDGSEIAFSAPVASRDGHFTNYIVSADGGTPSRLLPEDNGEQGDPTWSPDGKRILFYHSTPGSVVQEDLRILDRGTHQVTQVPGSTGMYSPRWSPDGRYIVGLVRQSNQLRIYDFETKKWIVIAEASGAGFLNFSRDSRTVYFVRYGTDQGIFSVGVNDGREKKLVDLNAFHFTGAVAVSMTLDPTDAPLVLRDIGTSDLYALSLDGK